MLQFDLFVTVFYAAVRSASNSIRFCKKQLLSCLLAIYIGRGLEYFRGNFKFFEFSFFRLIFNNARTFPSSIALISSRSLPVMDAMFVNPQPQVPYHDIIFLRKYLLYRITRIAQFVQ